MFSKEPRCRYGINPLGNVICQLRFPKILMIDSEAPARFQEMIREEYPRYSVRKEMPVPKLSGTPGNFSLENQPAGNNHQFTSADGIWTVNLTSSFISLSCSRYTCWEDFAQKLDKPLAAFIQLYKPAYFERVGLRYMNFISRSQLGLASCHFTELIESCYLGPMCEEDVQEEGFTRCVLDVEMAIRGGCRLKLHAGPGKVKRNGVEDPEVKFLFDQDLFMAGNIPVNMSAGALQTLHAQAYPIFRGAITDKLHNALLPQSY